jgi:hypothetical protein
VTQQRRHDGVNARGVDQRAVRRDAHDRVGVRFARRVVVSTMNGVPMLMFRMGNERSSNIVEATESFAEARFLMRGGTAP